MKATEICNVCGKEKTDFVESRAIDGFGPVGWRCADCWKSYPHKDFYRVQKKPAGTYSTTEDSSNSRESREAYAKAQMGETE